MVARGISGVSIGTGSTVREMARAVLAGAWTMIQARATRQQLLEMEPRMLADIGISHGDARMEASRAFWDVAARRR